MDKKDYYKILEITPSASFVEVKIAYRKLVHKYHPDIAGNTPEIVAKFKEITEAYEVLSSPQKREHYDSIMRLRGYGNNPQSKTTTSSQNQKSAETKRTSSTFQTSSSSQYRKYGTGRKENTFARTHERVQFNTKKTTFADSIENLFKNLKKNPQQKKQTNEKIDGKDVTVEIEIGILDAINGVEKSVNILHIEACSKCHGKRFINGATCSECGGTGETSVYKKMRVKIPAGVSQNTKIRIEKEGNAGFNGGKNGDLYLVVKLKNEPELRCEGLNVFKVVPVEPYEAVLGGFIDIQGIFSDTIQMKLVPNTYSGQKYRLAEQGLSKNGKKGDLIVEIKIDIPKNLSNAEIALYKQLGQLSKKSLRENE